MRFLSALALVAVATLAAAQNGTTSAPASTSAPTANCYHSYSYSCINDPACNWCFYYNAYASSIDYGSGNCYAKTTPCGSSTTGSTYNMTLSNPCVSQTTQTGCTGNPACGWCAASSKCFYVGLTSSSGSSVTSADTLLCAGVSMVRKATCSTAASSRESCVNLPYTCYWCNSACSSSYCSNIYDTVSCSWSTQRSCTTYESTTYINNGGACGWCSNYYGTNLSQCLFYTSGVPSSCSTSSSFVYNTYFGGGAAALALAIGLVGAVLIIVIVIPLVCVACIIGCSVYFCCIRPNRQTTVVVQAGGNQPYVPMNQPAKV